jgi:hypothetical protein
MHEVQEKTSASRVGIITVTFPFGSPETFLRSELEALTNLGFKLTIFPTVPKSKVNGHRDLDLEVVRFPLFGLGTILNAIRGARRNLRASLLALMTILRAKNDLATKLKNLALFPTGLP